MLVDKPEPAASRLEAIATLARAISHASWFVALGTPFTPGETEEAAAYLAALGRGGTEIAGAADWAEAKRIASDPGWDRDWWAAEERLQAALWQAACRDIPEQTLHRALSRVAEAAAETHQGAAAVAATRAGVADAGVIKSAAGAASQACHQAALGRAAGAGPGHVFAIKLRIFEAGRWPLGIVSGTYFVF